MAAGLLRAQRPGILPAGRANGHEHPVRGEGVLDGLWQRRERASGAASLVTALASAPSTTAALASALAVAPTALAVAPAALAGTLAPALATWSESRDP